MGWAAEAWLVSRMSPLDGSGWSNFRDCSHTSVIVKSGDLIPRGGGTADWDGTARRREAAPHERGVGRRVLLGI
jgi:hypothetical protein